ncbi:MAG: AAA+ family ATPase, partial [Verrucomicrobia bacterium]|nr:AAA+ family ATPase [Verrucomicrobiota bacterium]
VELITWRNETFAYAESYDQVQGRYRGLRAGQTISLTPDDPGLIVRPDVAQRQMEAEAPQAASSSGGVPTLESGPISAPGASEPSSVSAPPAGKPKPRRYHGTVRLDATRVGRDASRIADEVISHLAGQMGAEVSVVLEIEVRLPEGASDQLVRIVTENGQTLKFEPGHGFEVE